MKIKTSELTGASLDWAVAQCVYKKKGYKFQLVDDCSEPVAYSPSTNWEQGGPIIEREKIQIVFSIVDSSGGGYWVAANLFTDTYGCSGKAPLIAAMRCFVSSTIGDKVEVPNELL